MARTTINLIPWPNYEFYIDFWRTYGEYTSFRTLRATSESTIQNAVLHAKIKVPKCGIPPQPKGDIEIDINGNKAFDWIGLGEEEEVTIKEDISRMIAPPIGYPGRGANKVDFLFGNPAWPLFGVSYIIEYAYIELTYSGEIPAQEPEPAQQSGGWGFFNQEALDAMFATIFQIFIVMIIFNIFSSMF